MFGRFCFGGDWRKTSAGLEIVPKDGVRRRFHALLGEGEQNKLHLALETDRFAASQVILIKEDLSEVHFRVESDNPKRHFTALLVSGPPGKYTVTAGAKPIQEFDMKDKHDSVIELPMAASRVSSNFTISRVANR